MSSYNSDFFRRVVVWNKGDRKLLCLQNHTFQGLRLCTFPSYIRKIRNTDSLLLIFLHALQVLFVFLPSTDQAALPNREVLSYTDATDPCINPGFCAFRQCSFVENACPVTDPANQRHVMRNKQTGDLFSFTTRSSRSNICVLVAASNEETASSQMRSSGSKRSALRLPLSDAARLKVLLDTVSRLNYSILRA